MNVEVVNLVKHFGRTHAVDGISFRFGGGQVVGFVGPNGAGKTTTMRILATLEEPTAGDAFLDGVSVTQEPERVRRRIGYVPDEMPLYADTTVGEYLDFFARAFDLRGTRRRAAIESVVEFTRLGDLRDRLLRALSKGMRQRVSLARALVHEPDLLVLDEPAAGLDPRARVELRELLHLLAAGGRTVFISSHILTELTEICGSVVIIEKGRLVESGTIREVADRRAGALTVVVRALERGDELYRALLEMPQVEEVRRGANELLAALRGDERAAADLLAEIVRRGFPIAAFHPRRAGLEDIFMSVTKGDVQ